MLSIYEPDEPQAASQIRMTGVSFAVIDKYKNLVYRIALTVTGNHADAEDVLQEVFLCYFQTHPVFASEPHERAWFVRVALNKGRNVTRSLWNRRRVDVDLEEIPQPEKGSGNSPVLTAVLSLPERYRIAIYLHYYEDYNTGEIARIMGRSEAAVSQYLSRGRARLRKKLGGATHESA